MEQHHSLSLIKMVRTHSLDTEARTAMCYGNHAREPEKPPWQPLSDNPTCPFLPLPPTVFHPMKELCSDFLIQNQNTAEETDPFILLTLFYSMMQAQLQKKEIMGQNDYTNPARTQHQFVSLRAVQLIVFHHVEYDVLSQATTFLHNCLFLMEVLLLSSAEHKKLRPGKSRRSIRFHFWSLLQGMAFSIPKHTLHARHLHFWPYDRVSGSTFGTPVPEIWALSPVLLLLTHSAQLK